VLLFIGGEHDPEVLAAVATLGPKRAVLLDARDLSRRGWILSTGRPSEGWIVAAGRPLAISDLTGVVVRRLGVYPAELPHVQEQDRGYAASEMTALLLWWLHALPVRVMNRPGAGMLCGPGWRPAQWRAQAARLGYPVARCSRNSRAADPLPSRETEIVVAGGTVIGDPPAELAGCALSLARAANADLLHAAFDSSGRFLGAHPMPALSPAVLDAIASYIGLPA
jgi:hypothetical protein